MIYNVALISGVQQNYAYTYEHAQSLQSCLTLHDLMYCSPPGSSVLGTLQAKILEWVTVPFSRGFSQPRNQTQVSCVAVRLFTILATREACILYIVVCVSEKAIAPHSSTFAWKIPWTEEPGRLQSMGSQIIRQTRLSDFTFTFHFHALEKEMATHSSVLAWRIPRTAELVGCRLWGRTESNTTEVT